MPRSLFLALTATAALACASRPNPPAPVAKPVADPPRIARPAEAMIDHSGDSPETAVTVPSDAGNEGIDFQNNWIFDRYGRFRRVGGGIAHAGEGLATRRYEVVKIELADHSERTVYFDITENEKTWHTTRQ
jgi:hypothetical protein